MIGDWEVFQQISLEVHDGEAMELVVMGHSKGCW